MLNYFGVISMMPKNVANVLSSTFSIFVVGNFENYGEAYTQDRSIVKINQDGTKDTSFDNQNKVIRGRYIRFAIQDPNGQILISTIDIVTSYGASTSTVHLVDSSGNRNNTSNIYNLPSNMWTNLKDVAFDTSISSPNFGKAYVISNVSPLVIDGFTTSRLTRFNSDWTVDKTFSTMTNSFGFSSNINKVKILNDGNIIVGGSFTSYKNTTVNRICKLDTSGNVIILSGSGFDNSVNDIDEDSSGNLYVGGSFTTYNTSSAISIAKLSSTGVKDGTFVSQYPSGTVNQVIFDPNDNCLFVTSTYLNNSWMSTNSYSKGITKISSTTGLVKPSWFSPTTGLDSSSTIKIRFDSSSNSLFLFGRFFTYNGYNTSGMLKFNGTNGQVDLSFSRNSRLYDTSGIYRVLDFTILSDGKLILVGAFPYFKSTNYSSVKILPNGSIDSSIDLNPLSNYPVTMCIKDNKGNLFVNGPWGNVGLEKTFYINGAYNDYTNIPNNGYATGPVKITSTGSYVHAYVPRQKGLIESTGGTAEVLSMDIDHERYQLYLVGSFLSQPTASANQTNLVRICRVSATSGNIDAAFNTQYNASYFGFRNTSIGTVTNAANVNTVKYDSTINKVYCGGDFGGYNGLTASRIIRLTSTGSYDQTFQVFVSSTQSGFNNSVKILEVDRTGGPNDGKVYVGGDFTTYRGASQSRLARLNTDGTLDTSFSVGTGPNSTVRKIVIIPDGSLFISGSFTAYNGTSTSYVCKVNTNGTIDNSFSTGSGFQYAGLNDFTSSYSGSPTINNIKYDPAGKLYVIGSFAMYRGVAKNCIVRLNLDGTIDTTFNDNGYGLQNIGTGATDLILI